MNDTNDTPEPALIPIINQEARVNRIAFYLPETQPASEVAGVKVVDERDVESVPFLPGLNYVAEEELVACGFGGGVIPRAMAGKLVFEDPLTMDEFRATRLAATTVQRRSLEHWLECETRPAVAVAIRERLGSPQTR